MKFMTKIYKKYFLLETKQQNKMIPCKKLFSQHFKMKTKSKCSLVEIIKLLTSLAGFVVSSTYFQTFKSGLNKMKSSQPVCFCYKKCSDSIH